MRALALQATAEAAGKPSGKGGEPTAGWPSAQPPGVYRNEGQAGPAIRHKEQVAERSSRDIQQGAPGHLASAYTLTSYCRGVAAHCPLHDVTECLSIACCLKYILFIHS